MPITFIHGVSVRLTDLEKSREARMKMLEKYVLPVVTPAYPGFEVTDDIYWGDHGVQFRWDLASMFGADKAKALGPTEKTERKDLAAVLAELMAILAEGRSGAYGKSEKPLDDPNKVLVAAAHKDPTALVRAVVAPERNRFEPDFRSIAEPGVSKAPAEESGRDTALLLIAADEASRSPELILSLKQAKTAKSVLELIRKAIESELSKMESGSESAKPETPRALGKAGKKGTGKGINDRLRALLDATMDASSWAADKALAARVYTAGIVAWPYDQRLAPYLRREYGYQAMLFFGDVFEYLRRGQGNAESLGSIAETVAKGIKAGAGIAKLKHEPLVVVTHSFGSAIFYDLMTSTDLAEIPVQLWVMAGAQVSLFAEMAIYRKNPDTHPGTLPKPPNVRTWLNFYHDADLFSFHAEPVFGKTAVRDIRMPGKQSLLAAHSAYFTEPFFYQEIAKTLQELSA
jgi:hypothetical protein